MVERIQPDRIVLEVKHLDLRIGGAHIINDVSFSVPQGELLGVIGHNGAGKSTLARLLFRFYDLTAGRITVDGVDIRQLSTADLRSIIGFVQQDLFLFTGDILHNLTLDAPVAPEAARQAARRVGAGRTAMSFARPVAPPPPKHATRSGASSGGQPRSIHRTIS